MSQTTAVLTSGLERIPDQLGYLVISEDGVLASAGELENDENTAAVMMQMVRTASRFRLPGSADPSFKRMSGEKLYWSALWNQPCTSPVNFWPYSSTTSGHKLELKHADLKKKKKKICRKKRGADGKSK
uniref:Ragulator complex protein LAMTOR4 n=1 Tax=Takifugu rubripes TaxID=31033 RepID=H2RMR9_TAKRU